MSAGDKDVLHMDEAGYMHWRKRYRDNTVSAP